MIKVKAPARICFFGDHQDYLNLPVIAGTIDKYITIKGKPNNSSTFYIQLIDLDSYKIIELNESFSNIQDEDFFRSVLIVLKNAGFSFSQGYDIKISGNIPINAGLSSSSALVVAWIRFLLSAENKENEVSNQQIGQWAYEAEVLFFNGQGGLMDQYTIAQGGMLYIDTEHSKTYRLENNLGLLVVAESGIAKKTQSVLKNAKTYGIAAIESVNSEVSDFKIQKAGREDYYKYLNIVPEIYKNYWFAAVFSHILTQKARKMLGKKSFDFVKLGRWMNEHQVILQDRICNTPLSMQKQMNAAIKAGALGTKIIGSGGGGCMVAMVSENSKQKVIQAFLNNGAKDAYEINLTSG